MNKGEGPYRVLSRARIATDDIVLRAVEPSDIEAIRQWRNAQMDVLRQTAPITHEAQVRYFSEHVWPEKLKQEPAQILLAIERFDELTGYGGLVHISWPNRRAEVSFLLAPELERDRTAHCRIFEVYLRLLKSLAFDDLALMRLTSETFSGRDHVIATFERSGFTREGRLRNHVVVGERRVDALMHGCNAPSKGVAGRNVLVTSASRKAPLLRAMKDALSRIAPEAQVIAGDIDPDAPARHLADDFWCMPQTEDWELETLIAECRARGIGAVLPTRDGELGFWARHRPAFAAAGIAVFVSSSESIQRCLDKLSFARFGVEKRLPIIRTAETPEVLGEGPFVVKERFGAGGRGIGINLDAEAANAHARALDAPLFQPYVAGSEFSIDAWINGRGNVKGVVLRRRDRVIGGESQVTSTFHDLDLEAKAREVLECLDLRGPVVMQAILSSDGMEIIEVNPRFGGASTLAIAAGLDSLYWSLAEVFVAGEAPKFEPYKGRLRQVRLPADIILHDPNL